MIWLTWRQYRFAALAVLVPVVAVAAMLAVTGPSLAGMLDTWGEDFFTVLDSDDLKEAVYLAGLAVAYAVPAVIGVFWGAPLVAREVEAGTHRLVWTQAVTRTRWLGTKLVVIGAGAVAAGLLALGATWWAGPIDDAIAAGYASDSAMGVPRLVPALFGGRGFVPLALALFAVAVGVAAGMLLRRTVPAMALTLVAVVGTQIALPTFVQANLLDPSTTTITIDRDNLDGLTAFGNPRDGVGGLRSIEVDVARPGAWMLGQATVDADGEVVTDFPAEVDECFAKGPQAFDECFTVLEDLGFQQRVEYLPASKFWALQALESGLVLAVAAGLVGFCFWRVRRDF